MSQAVDLDNMRYQAELDAWEKRQDWLIGATAEVVKEWRLELDKTGIIVDLGWELADLKLVALEEAKDLDACLYDHARQWVEANESDFNNESLNWD